MRIAGLVLSLLWMLWPILGVAQDTADTEKIADTMVRLCVGGGRTEAIGGTAAGGADLKGEFKIDKSSAEGLVNGLDNALSQVAADEADKVRASLEPVRERLLGVLVPPKKQGQSVTAPGGVAVGGDVKNSPITVGPPPQPTGR
jgi:hypothetical protein